MGTEFQFPVRSVQKTLVQIPDIVVSQTTCLEEIILLAKSGLTTGPRRSQVQFVAVGIKQ